MAVKAKVLLVDDDADHLLALSICLQDEGYEVFTAENGDEGMHLALEHQPDVAVLDVMMRNTEEGFVLARSMRAEARLADTRLLILSGVGKHFGMDFEPDELWLPVDKVLEKPIEVRALAEEVAAVLAEPRQRED